LGSFGIFVFTTIEISFLRRKTALPLKAGEKTEYRIQNTEDRIQKTANIKVKTISYSSPPQAEKASLIDYLTWTYPPNEVAGKLDLRPCPAGRYAFIY
jgi:hypothetical protein